MKKPIPHSFVLEELEDLHPITKPMFGAHSVYVNGMIVLILRSRETYTSDNGVWLATSGEHHASLQKDFPSMKSIDLFGPGPTGWQVLPESADDFEESVLRACALIRRQDPRIGKIPRARRSRKTVRKTKAPAKRKR